MRVPPRWGPVAASLTGRSGGQCKPKPPLDPGRDCSNILRSITSGPSRTRQPTALWHGGTHDAARGQTREHEMSGHFDWTAIRACEREADRMRERLKALI